MDKSWIELAKWLESATSSPTNQEVREQAEKIYGPNYENSSLYNFLSEHITGGSSRRLLAPARRRLVASLKVQSESSEDYVKKISLPGKEGRKSVRHPPNTEWSTEFAMLWLAMEEEDIDEALAMCRKSPELLKHKVEEEGNSTLFLSALRKGLFDFSKRLLSEYPDLIHQEFEDPWYGGQNALHIAICKQSLEMAEHLIELKPELINGRATGKYFEPGTDTGYGELPLFFAVSTNQPDIIELLLSKGADIFAIDSSGNNILHFTVYHTNPELYDFIVKKMDVEGVKKYGAEKWETIRFACHSRVNDDGLSAMNLPSTFGQGLDAFTDLTMFEKILKDNVKCMWFYGEQQCNYYPLDGVDHIDPGTQKILKDEFGCKTKPLTTLEALVKFECEEMTTIPLIKKLLALKWEQGWQTAFFARATIFAFYFIFYNLSVWGDYPILWGITMVLTTIKGFIELKEIITQGYSDYFTASGVGALENVLASLFCSLTISSVGVSYFIDPEWERVPLSLATLALWFYIAYFFMAMQATGTLVSMVATMITQDVVRFLLLFSVPLCAFAKAIQVMKHDSSFSECLNYTLLTTLGNAPDDFAGDGEVMVKFLSAMWLIVSTILLVNLLIAMMGSTYSIMAEESESVWMMLRAGIGLMLEDEMPSLAKKKQKYHIVWEGRRWFRCEEKEQVWVTGPRDNQTK